MSVIKLMIANDSENTDMIDITRGGHREGTLLIKGGSEEE